MAEVVAPGQGADPTLPQLQLHPLRRDAPPPNPPHINTTTTTIAAPNNKKRPADSSLDSEQRLSKRFDLLNLENGTRLYLPVPSAHDAALNTSSSKPQSQAQAHPLPSSPRQKRPRAPRAPASDSMQVEDTPHRIYISDLDAELSDLESDSETPIFLPDIEAHLAKLPAHVLLAAGERPSQQLLPPELLQPTPENQIVLYSVPRSLSVPEERDSVGRAIGEARERVRRRVEGGEVEAEGVGNGVGEEVGETVGFEADDEMEID